MAYVCRCTLVFILACALPYISSAQLNTTFSGAVEDQSGAVVPLARVTLLSRRNSESRQVSTNDEGHFGLKGVSSGAYLLRVEREGFQKFETTVTVANEPVDLKIRIRIAASEQITVNSSVTDRVSADSNGDAVKLNDNLLRTLPTQSDNLLPLLQQFISPAAAGTSRMSVLVDGIESDQLDDLPNSAIKRVAIDKNPYSAEYRRPGKARVEVTTKTGSRTLFHGGIALFWRNSALDARNPLARTKPNLNRRLWDATFSGPLIINKASFFLAGQHLGVDESAVVNAWTLNGPLIRNVPGTQSRTDLLGRVDFRASTHSLSFLYGLDRRQQENYGVGGLYLGETGNSRVERAQNFRAVDQAILSPTFLTTFRFLARKQTIDIGEFPSGPAIIVNGAFVGGVPQASRLEHENFLEFDNVTLHSHGRHTLRFGGTGRIRMVHGIDQSNFGGTFEFANLTQFSLGVPFVFRINQGEPDVSFQTQEVSGFLQDEIKLRANLSLTSGLRYDWQSSLDRRNNFAPRIAVAYAPGDQRTVWRAGAGIFYENLPGAALWRAYLLNGTRQTEWVIPNPGFPNATPSGGWNVSPSIYRLAPGLKSPYLIHASISVEWQLWPETQLTLEGYAMHGIHMLRTRNVNAPLPGTGIRPVSSLLNLNQLESTAMLRSTGFAVSFRGRLSKRAYVVAQYTLSRSTNDTSGIFSLPANNYDLLAERGRADFDRRHRFTLTGMVDLPGSMRVGTVLALSSAAPFDITTGFDQNHDTAATDRPAGVTRNTGQGTGLAQLDVRFTKSFRLPRLFNREGGTKNVDLNLDAFNVINHTSVSSFVGVESSVLFGRPVATLPARTLQLSIRYRF
jgi:TonB dependent receptor/Carboxypeptidase regulatory-like domain